MKAIQLLMILCCITWLASCSNDDDGGTGGDRVAVQFGTGNIAQTKTTTDGTQWVAGDKIGIFMVNEGKGLSAAEIAEEADNIPYKADNGAASSTFSSVDGTPIYYPDNGDKVDFIAYYPYKAPLANYIYPIDIKDQTNPAAIDFLYSNNATGYNNSNGTVALGFEHKLCRIVLNLSDAGSGMTQSSFMNMLSSDVSFLGFPVEATIDLEDGTVNPSADRSQIFNPTKTASPPAGYRAQFTAIVIPGPTTVPKITFHFSNIAKNYMYNMPASLNFASGAQYTFFLTFHPKARSLAVESSDNEITELQVTEIKQEVWR